MYRVSLFIFAFSLLSFFGCSSNSSGPTNGDLGDINLGNSSAVIKTDMGEHSFQYAVSVYMPERNMTWVVASNVALDEEHEYETGLNWLEVGVRGSGVGVYQFSDDNEIYLLIDDEYYYSVNGTGTIRLDRYGDVGSYIEGTFTGTLSNGTTDIEVQAASFRAMRMPDEDIDEWDDWDDNDRNEKNAIKTEIKFNDSFYFLSRSGLEGSAGYFNQAFGMLLYYYEGDDTILGISINLREFDNVPQTLHFERTMDGSSFILTYYDQMFVFEGELEITKVAEERGDYYEAIGTGSLYRMGDMSKAGDFEVLEFSVVRHQ